MFVPAIKGQGTDEQQQKWLPLAYKMQIIGCYAQTELGHGSNVQGLETTATFDPSTDEFVIHSPTLTSSKVSQKEKTSSFYSIWVDEEMLYCVLGIFHAVMSLIFLHLKVQVIYLLYVYVQNSGGLEDWVKCLPMVSFMLVLLQMVKIMVFMVRTSQLFVLVHIGHVRLSPATG